MSSLDERDTVSTAPAGRPAIVNGTPLEIGTDDGATPLAEVLRAAGHTEVKIGCGEGICGTCTVDIDGKATPACIVPAARARGAAIRTSAAVAETGAGYSTAVEFSRRNGLHCGFCAPGMLTTTSQIVAQVRAEAEHQGNQAPPGAPTLGAQDTVTLTSEILDGHLCRCSGYQGAVACINRAATSTTTGTPTRLGGFERATGATDFTADGLPDGTAHGMLITCRSPHATVRISAGSALDVPGAIAVLGPEDSPSWRFSTNPHVADAVLAPAEDQVFAAEGRWAGEIVGMVVASSPAAARAMAKRIEQVESPLAAATDIDAATRPGAVPVDSRRADNVVFSHAVGGSEEELEEAFRRADSTWTETFDIAAGPHAALERPSAFAAWDGPSLRLRSTSQTPQVVRSRLAELFGLPAERVDVDAVPLGGGFGLKEEITLEPVAAVAARAVGRPVLVEASRAQVALLRRRHPARITVRSACDDSGRIVARSVHIELDAGATVGHSALILENALLLATNVYKIPVLRATGRVVLTNTTPSGAFRGYGAGELTFAIESQMETLARHFGADPIEYRRRHARVGGELDAVNHWTLDSFAAHECLDAVDKQRRHPPVAPDGQEYWRTGRGFAFFAIVSSASSAAHLDSAEASISIDHDGYLVVQTPVPEMGTGLHTILTTAVAHQLGVPEARVRVQHLQRPDGPSDEGTFATRGVYVTSNAVAQAAALLAEAISVRAAESFDCPAEPVSFWPGGVTIGERHLPLNFFEGLSATARYVAPDNGLVAGAQMVDVAVNVRTGMVVILRVVSAHDVGHVLDPDMARGQVLGGVIQGTGIALSERLRHRDGLPIDVNLLDQGVPTSQVEPEVVDIYVGDGQARGPLGAKGLGEAPVVGVPAAIANAIHDAIGVRTTSLPVDPEFLVRLNDEDRSRT